MSLNIYTNPISRDAMTAYLKWNHKEMFDTMESLSPEDLEDFMTFFTSNADPLRDRMDNAAKRLLELIKEKYEEIKRTQSPPELPQSRKDFWDKVIKRLDRQPYESDGNGGKKRVPNSKMYHIYEHSFGDLTEGMTPKQVAAKINEQASKYH
jgi:hypothetical protein